MLDRQRTWSKYTTPDPPDMGLVGCTWLPHVDGSYRVLEIATDRDAAQVVEQAQVGDHLLHVDQQDIRTAFFMEISAHNKF